MSIPGQYFQISDECHWQFMLQVFCVSQSVMSHQARGKGPKSCLTSFFSFTRVMTGSGDRVSSWAAAVVVDRVYAICPWETLLFRDFNQSLSQRGMYLCLVITYSTLWINRVMLPILLVTSCTGSINTFLSPYVPENLVSRNGFSRPVPRHPGHSPYSD